MILRPCLAAYYMYSEFVSALAPTKMSIATEKCFIINYNYKYYVLFFGFYILFYSNSILFYLNYQNP